MRKRNIFVLFAVLVGVVALLPSLPSGADDNGNNFPTFQHAVKFMCGQHNEIDEDPVAQGDYFTAINVHNPNSHTVKGNATTAGGPSDSQSFSQSFRKKALILFPQDEINNEPAPPETPQEPGAWFRPAQLRPDWGFEIDCRDIRMLACPPPPLECVSPQFIKGFVVIEATGRLPLDVVAAYTAELGTGSPEVEIETIQPKRIRSG
jgi:hypothetical protein